MKQQDEDFNPFQAPAVPYSQDHVGDSSDEAIRREYLSHEAAVQSIGFLYYLGAFLLLVASIWLLVMPTDGLPSFEGQLLRVLLPVLAIGQLCAAYGLRKLKSWARIPTGLISGIGLIGFPTGTLINAYILYLIFSSKGRMVFSEEYREVIDQTPHIKYKTSTIVWILVFILLAFIALGVGLAFIG